MCLNVGDAPNALNGATVHAPQSNAKMMGKTSLVLLGRRRRIALSTVQHFAGTQCVNLSIHHFHLSL